MDHQTAIKTLAAERYVLGELTGAEREAYEEHAFNCVVCAAELKATADFKETLQETLKGEATKAKQHASSLCNLLLIIMATLLIIVWFARRSNDLLPATAVALFSCGASHRRQPVIAVVLGGIAAALNFLIISEATGSGIIQKFLTGTVVVLWFLLIFSDRLISPRGRVAHG
jgi:anti-sigma factor RsiW